MAQILIVLIICLLFVAIIISISSLKENYTGASSGVLQGPVQLKTLVKGILDACQKDSEYGSDKYIQTGHNIIWSTIKRQEQKDKNILLGQIIPIYDPRNKYGQLLDYNGVILRRLDKEFSYSEYKSLATTMGEIFNGSFKIPSFQDKNLIGGPLYPVFEENKKEKINVSAYKKFAFDTYGMQVYKNKNNQYVASLDLQDPYNKSVGFINSKGTVFYPTNGFSTEPFDITDPCTENVKLYMVVDFEVEK